MESKSINPNNGMVEILADLNQRIKSLESAPAGQIVIRESITTKDPNTGVETVFGTLPDGTHGIQEFINDTTPPEKPSTPTLKSVFGVFEVTWNGKDYLGAAQPRDYLRTVVEMSTNGVSGWVEKEYYTGIGAAGTRMISDEPYAEVRHFRLISYDQNKNASVPSAIVSAENTSTFNDATFQEKIAEVAKAAEDAQKASNTAQINLNKATAAADLAKKALLAVAGITDPKGKVLVQSTTPVAADRNAYTLWIDTTGGTNTPKSWNGTTWVASTVQAVKDAAAKVVTAQNAADQADLAADLAAEHAGNTLSFANGAGTNWYQKEPPAGANHNINDVWFKEPTNEVYRWDGEAWVSIRDDGITAAFDKAAAAEAKATAADTKAGDAAVVAGKAQEDAIAASNLSGTKSKVIYSSVAPGAADRNTSVLWIDTTNNQFTPKRWISGTNWESITDKVAVDAAVLAGQANAIAATKTTTFYGTSATATVVGDLWVDSTLINGVAGNVLKRWSGSAWVVVQDKKLQDALTAAGDAQSTADGKIKTYAQITPPTGLLAKDVGDIWIDTDEGNKLYRWQLDGTTWKWVAVQDTSIAAAAQLAGAAQSAASDASQAAVDATNLAKTKGKVLIQSTAPGIDDRNPYTLWIDTTDINGAPGNVPKRWTTGTTWVAVTDKVATDAAAAAAAAAAKADAAFKEATAAAIAAGNAQTAANGKGRVWYQGSAPAGTGHTDNDIWFKTPTNEIHIWNGTTKLWVSSRDKNLTDATTEIIAQAERITAVKASADGKNSIWHQNEPPAGTAHRDGDTWFDTNDGNRPLIWRGAPTNAWLSARDATIAAAQSKADTAYSTANGKNTTYYQTDQPTGGSYVKGDMWVDTDGGNRLSTYSGIAWQTIQDALAAKSEAITESAADAQAKADKALADAKIDASTKATAAQTAAIEAAAEDAKAKADATQAAVNITINQLRESGANLVLDPSVESTNTAIWSNRRTTESARTGVGSLKVTASGTGVQDVSLTPNMVMTPGRVYYMEAWVKTPAATWTGTVNLASTLRKTDGTYVWPSATGGTGVSYLSNNSGQDWTKLSGYLTVPTGVVSGSIRISVRNDVTAGTVFYWDDFLVLDVTESQAAITAAEKASAEALSAKTAAEAAKGVADKAAADVLAVPAKIETAKQAAITAAALVSESKASAAQTAAITAAASDAKAKADAAQAAAIATAKVASDLSAAGAQSAAIAAAATDAQVKADAAKADAIQAAQVGNGYTNQWLRSILTRPSGSLTDAPAPEEFSNPGVVRAYVSDQADLARELGQYYIGSLRTLVYVAAAKTLSFTASHDDGGSIYVDGLKVYGVISTASAKPFSVPLTAGWHVLEFTWNENTGLDGWWAITPTIGSLVTEMKAPSLANAAQWDAAMVQATAAADAKAKANQALTDAKADAKLKADAAQAAAILAAKADAKLQSEAAEARAAVTAATTAQAKADAAQAAALDAAKTYADTQSSGASSDALAAAKLDATTKADAAKAAAIAAASLDATAKKEQAEATAAADAKTKADKALADAKVDTTTKTSAAQAAAIAAATADAKAKADAAQAAAIAAAATDATAKAAQAKTDAVTAAANDATAKANTAKADAVSAAASDATAKANLAKTDAVSAAATMTNGIGKNLSSTLAPSVSNAAAQGSVWRRTDASGRIIGVWEQTAAGVGSTWTPRLITSEVVDNIDIGKLSASSANINTAVVGKLSAGIADVIELNASRITAGTVGADRIDANIIRAKIISAPLINATDIIAKGTITSASGVFGDISASSITSGSIAAARIDASLIRSKIVEADLIDAKDIIATGSITATSGTIGSIDATVITTGELNGDLIKGGTVAAHKLVVGAFDNMFHEPDFNNKGKSWTMPSTSSIVAGAGRSGGPVLRSAATGTTFSNYNLPYSRPVEANSAWRVTAWVRSSVSAPAASVWLFAALTLSSGAITYPSVKSPALPANQWVQISGVIEAPSSTISASWAVSSRAEFPVGAYFDVDYVSATRMSNGELIVDGSITALSLKAGTITSDSGIIGSLDAGVITAGTLDASRINVKNLTADQVIIGGGGNLHPDSGMLDDAGWNGAGPASAGKLEGVGTGRNGGKSFLIPASTGAAYAYYSENRAEKWMPITGGSVYRVRTWAKASAAVAASGVRIFFRNSTRPGGTQINASANAQAMAANVWTLIDVTFTAAADSTIATVAPYVSAGTNVAVRFSDFSVQAMTTGDLLVNGSVTADSIKGGSITTENGTIGNFDAGAISSGFINAARIEARSLSVDTLLVSSMDNMLSEPNFDANLRGWGGVASPIGIQKTASRNGTQAMTIAGSATQSGRYNVPGFPVDTGNVYRVTAWIKSTVAIPAGGVTIFFRRTTTTGSTAITGIANSAATAANTWAKLTGIYEIPTNIVKGEVGIFSNASLATGTLYVDSVMCARAADGTLIVDGAVTASSLESKLILSSKIIAGPEDGTHAEMAPSGFRVFAADTAGGSPNEVVRLGVASTDDYFAITKANGDLAATISQDGKISGDQINANSSLFYKGQELDDILSGGPRGVVAAAYRDTYSKNNTVSGGAAFPFLRLEAVMERGRLYRISVTPTQVDVSSGTTALFGLGYRFDAIATVQTQNTLTRVSVNNTGESHSLSELWAYSTGDATRTVSFLIWFAVSAGPGEAGIRSTGAAPTRLVIEDVGPGGSNIGNGVQLDGTAAPAPAKNTYVRQYRSTGSMNYQGSNAQYNYDTGNMYQGLSPAGMGNTKSISLHPDMMTDLSGATINYVRVYMVFKHWYYNAGGTARIGLHGHTSIPGTFSGSGIAVTSGGWPRPGARWVNLPSSVFNGFKTGAYRGIYLEGDGTYGTYGIADRPTIEIGYTK